MTYAQIHTAKEDVPRRTLAGHRHLAVPTDHGKGEVFLHPTPCRLCAKRELHKVLEDIVIEVPFDRVDSMPDKYRPSLDELNALQALLHYTNFSSHGYIKNVVWNAGAANNAAQFEQFEMISGSGNTLTLMGKNPKKIPVTSSRVNFSWPAADPETGETSLLITETVYFALPPGASIEFLPESVLAEKFEPIISKVNMPASTAEDDVTFSVEITGGSVGNALTPIDDALPPENGKYYCRIWFEATTSADWRNFNAAIDARFASHSMEITSAAIHDVKNVDDEDCRVTFPGMLEGSAFQCEMFLQAGGTQMMLDSEILTNLSTTKEAGLNNWKTTFNAIGYDFATTYSKFVLTYYAEVGHGTVADINMAGSCANSQLDPTGSIVHGIARHCTAVDSTGFAAYQDQCWKPSECDKFCLGTGDTNTYQPNNMELPPDAFRDSDWLSSLWHRASWIAVQSPEDPSDISLTRPSLGGPSVGQLCGGWRDEILSGRFPLKWEMQGAAFGQRITWRDSNDDDFHYILYGAFYQRGDDLTSFDHDDYSWDAAAADGPPNGVIAANVTGWGTKPAGDGEDEPDFLAKLPYRETGRTKVYEFSHGFNNLRGAVELAEDYDSTAPSVDLTAEDTAITDLVPDGIF